METRRFHAYRAVAAEATIQQHNTNTRNRATEEHYTSNSGYNSYSQPLFPVVHVMFR